MAVVTININGTKEILNIDGPKEAVDVKIYDAIGKINVWRRNTKVASFVVKNLESYSYSVTDEAPPAQESRHPSKTKLIKMEPTRSHTWDELRLEFKDVSEHFSADALDKMRMISEPVEVDMDMTVRELFVAIIAGRGGRLVRA